MIDRKRKKEWKKEKICNALVVHHITLRFIKILWSALHTISMSSDPKDREEKKKTMFDVEEEKKNCREKRWCYAEQQRRKREKGRKNVIGSSWRTSEHCGLGTYWLCAIIKKKFFFFFRRLMIFSYQDFFFVLCL